MHWLATLCKNSAKSLSNLYEEIKSNFIKNWICDHRNILKNPWGIDKCDKFLFNLNETSLSLILSNWLYFLWMNLEKETKSLKTNNHRTDVEYDVYFAISTKCENILKKLFEENNQKLS